MVVLEEANVIEYVPCPRCGCEDSRTVVRGIDRLHHTPGEYLAVECLRCRLWFQNPRPSADRLSSLYPKDYSPHQKPVVPAINSGYAGYLKKNLGYKSLKYDIKDDMEFNRCHLKMFDSIRRWQAGVNLIPEYIAGGKLLEIGCASGGRLLLLRRLGWHHLYGIELVEAAFEKARKEKFEVTCGPVEDTLNNYPDAAFDVIVSSMVLEHLYDPFEVVRIVAKKLKPGGQFLFSTVIRDGLDGRLFQEYWGGFDFPRHMIYFVKDDVVDMLKYYFEDLKFYHQNAPIDFVRSAVWKKQEGKGTIIDDIALKIAESSLARPVGLLLAWVGLTCRVSIRCRKKNA